MIVKGNLIIDKNYGTILPVQHIRGFGLMGPNVTVKIAGASDSMIQMDLEKNESEIYEELSNAYLLALRNYEQKMYEIAPQSPQQLKPGEMILIKD